MRLNRPRNFIFCIALCLTNSLSAFCQPKGGRIEQADSGVLAEGPLLVRVYHADKREPVEGILFHITLNQVVYHEVVRDKNKPKPALYAPLRDTDTTDKVICWSENESTGFRSIEPKSRIIRVEAKLPDGRLTTWTLDLKKSNYQGDVYIPKLPDLSGSAPTRDNESKTIYYLFDRYLPWAESAARSGDVKQLDNIARFSKIYQDHIKKKSYDSALTDLYVRLDNALQLFKSIIKKRVEIEKAYQNIINNYNKADRDNLNKKHHEQSMAMIKSMAGLIGETQSFITPEGLMESRWRSDVNLMMSGASDHHKAALQYENERNMIELKKRVLDEKTTLAYSDLSEQITKEVQSCREAYIASGIKAFGHDYSEYQRLTDLRVSAYTNDETKPLLKHFENHLVSNKLHGYIDNPFIHFTKASYVIKNNMSANVNFIHNITEAESALQSMALLPSSQIFDDARYSLLLTLAHDLNTSAWSARGSRTLFMTYNPSCLYSLRLLNFLDTRNIHEVLITNIDLQRAYAHALCSRSTESIKFITGIGNIFADNILYHYRVSRVYASAAEEVKRLNRASKIKEFEQYATSAAHHMKIAIDKGYPKDSVTKIKDFEYLIKLPAFKGILN